MNLTTHGFRHAFLFNDVLVLTSADNSRKVARVLPLYKSHVDFGDDGENEDVGSESTITVTSGKEEVTLDFIEDDTYSVWCTWLQECIARTSPVSQVRIRYGMAQDETLTEPAIAHTGNVWAGA